MPHRRLWMFDGDTNEDGLRASARAHRGESPRFENRAAGVDASVNRGLMTTMVNAMRGPTMRPLGCAALFCLM